MTLARFLADVGLFVGCALMVPILLSSVLSDIPSRARARRNHPAARVRVLREAHDAPVPIRRDADECQAA